MSEIVVLRLVRSIVLFKLDIAKNRSSKIIGSDLISNLMFTLSNSSRIWVHVDRRTDASVVCRLVG